MEYRKLMNQTGESSSLYYITYGGGIGLQSLYLETVYTKEVINELHNQRSIKSLVVGEGLELSTIKEKLFISVSLRHFRRSRLKKMCKEIERGTTK